MICTFLAALGSGLMAGLFFAFSCFVMTALGRLPGAQGAAAMQSINVAILNPLFLLVFLGTAVLCVGLAGWGAWHGEWLIAGGASLYLLCCMAVTMIWNVPLNESLAREGAQVWSGYLVTWTAWNHVRTAGCTAAMGFLIAALMRHAR